MGHEGGRMDLASIIGVGVMTFASTNIDDIFILSTFFADSHLPRPSIVIGQFVGIGALVLISVLAALLALEFTYYQACALCFRRELTD